MKLTALSFRYTKVAPLEHLLKLFQAADIRSQYNQITQAWTKLHSNLRCDVPEPTEKTTIADFLSQLEVQLGPSLGDLVVLRSDVSNLGVSETV